MSAGKCRGMDPSLFFPTDAAGFGHARRLCQGCPVTTPCLEYALSNRIDDGVWGGVSQRERVRVRRRRKLSAAKDPRAIR